MDAPACPRHDRPGPDETAGYVRVLNANWIVLGGILEDIIKPETIDSYFRTHIADPAGMSSRSTFHPDKQLLKRLAHPYERQANGTLKSEWINGYGPPTSYYGEVFTDGGLISTATDLAKFGTALIVGGSGKQHLVDTNTLEAVEREELGLNAGGWLASAAPTAGTSARTTPIRSAS